MNTYLAALDCEIEVSGECRVGIVLTLLDERDQCARVMLEGTDRLKIEPELAQFSYQQEYRKIYVRQQIWNYRPPMDFLYGFWLRMLPSKVTQEFSYRKGIVHSISEVTSYNTWNREKRFLQIPVGSSGTAGAVWFKDETESRYSVLKLGFDTLFNPVCQFRRPLWGTSQNLAPSGDFEEIMRAR
jgi:hypothetical protein